MTMLAIPITAVVLLSAGPFEMGLLRAAQLLPFLVLGLLAGVMVDRLPRRPTIIAADMARGLLLIAIPAAMFLDVLDLGYLYLIAFVFGTSTLMSDIAGAAVLPALIPRHRLFEGNSKLEMGQSVARISGPAIAGGLIGALTAPVAILFNSLSFFMSAVILATSRIGAFSVQPHRSAPPGIVREIGEGLSLVIRSPILRAIALSSACANFCISMLGSVYIVYLTRDLSLEPVLIGVILAAGGPGALAGAITAERLANRIGLGPALAATAVLAGSGGVLIVLADDARLQSVVVLMVAQVVQAVGVTAYNANQVSLRQAITPDAILGRMNATVRFVARGTLPIGALVGGIVGEGLGLRATILIAGFGMVAASAWLFLPAVWSVRVPSTRLTPTETIETRSSRFPE